MLDSNNIKSYTGPAMTNIATEISPRGISDNGSTYRFFSGTDTDYIPSMGNVTYSYVDMYNDYNGGSGNCCPSPFGYGQGLTVTGSTLYTYGILYRSANRYTNPNLMYHYEYNGGTYLTEFGVHNAGYSWQETDLGNGWYWSRAKFTSQPTANIFYTGSWMYQYATWNRWEVAKILISPGDWTNLHPKYWPAVGTTRSSTGIVYDLTSNKTITANSLTYANDGTFSFNGSSDYLSMTNTTLGNGNLPWTVSAWVKTTTTTNSLGQGSVLSNSSGGPVYSMMGVNNGKIVYWTYHSGWYQSLGNITVNDGNWHMLTWVNYANYTMDMYVDGILDVNVSNSTSGNNNPVDRIGGSWAGYFPGSISAMQIYNQALTAPEVKQNFNATRGRYGL